MSIIKENPLEFTLLLVFVLVWCFSSPPGSTSGAILFLIVLLLFFIRIFYKAYKKGKETARARENMSYDRATKVLTLYTVSPINANIVSVVADYDFKTSYQPEKIVYTGATVGGITTGGFHKEGGYSYISGATKNGGAFLVYISIELVRGEYKNRDNLIARIELSDEAFKEAIRCGILPASSTSKSVVTYTTNGPLPYSKICKIRNFICGE